MPLAQFQHIACQREISVLVVQLLDEKIHGDELAETLRQELFMALDQFPSRKVLVDFLKVDSFSSVGFRPFLSLHRKLKMGNGRLMFCRLKPDLVEIFKTTRLVSTRGSSLAPFELADDLEDALGRLRGHLCRLEEDVLILTLTEPEMQGDTLAEQMDEELLLSAKSYNAERIIVDFAQVETLGTPCLRPFLHLRSLVQGKGGRMVFCNLAPMLSHALAQTRLISSSSSGQVPFESANDLTSALALVKTS